MNYNVTAKRIVKSIASPVLDFCGIYDALLQRRVFTQSNWLIVMYHRVIDNAADDPFRLGMCLDSKLFAQQIEYHVQHFTPITVGEAVARVRAGKPLPRNAVSVTFDDGYRDFKDVALPILKRYQCPSTVFVTTGGLEDGQVFWWDRVLDAIFLTQRKFVDVGFLSDEPSSDILSLSIQHRNRSLDRLLDLFWNQPPARIEEQVDTFRRKLGVVMNGKLLAPRMSHAEIAEVSGDDVELGAHCEQHVDMRKLSTDACRHELEASRRLLQEVSGQPVNGFAYPGGRENSDVQKLVAHTGYTYAAGTSCSLNRPPYDMYSLRRLGAPDTGVSDYKRCLATAAGAAPQAVAFESVPWP